MINNNVNTTDTIKGLINLYYDVCDRWSDYLPINANPTEIAQYRANIVNTLYILCYGKMPLGSNTFTLLRLLNNDFLNKRLTAEQILKRIMIKYNNEKR